MTLLVMIYALCRPQTKPKAEFVPPPFESEAQQGVPDVPEELGYSSPDRDDMSYDFAVCGKGWDSMSLKKNTNIFSNAFPRYALIIFCQQRRRNF